jgi:hypothetical protein
VTPARALENAGVAFRQTDRGQGILLLNDTGAPLGKGVVQRRG